MRQYWVILMVCFSTLSGHAIAEPDTQKVEQLLEVTGALDLGKQMSSAMMDRLSPLYPEEAHPLLQRLLASLQGDEYKAIIVGIYQKNFTEGEIDALITFYTSEHGKTIVKKMPSVVQESMKIGGAFGQMKVREILEQMRKEGYEPEKA